MARRSGVFILELHANAICLFDHVAVGNDVALGVDNHTGTERALADGSRIGTALATLAPEKFVEEILEGSVVIAALILVRIGTCGVPSPARVLNGRLGIDIHHA